MNAKLIFIGLFLIPFVIQAKSIPYQEYYKETKGCFILLDVKKNKIIEEYGKVFCKAPMAPNSTFKIPLSLMGYDKKILIDENNPKWEFKEEYLNRPYEFEGGVPAQWKQSNTPSSWMKYSVVWYSQKLTPMLGIKVIDEYLNKFNYGNKKFTDGAEKNDALNGAWLESSLKISAENQVQFLNKFVLGTLPVNKQSIEMTKKLLSLNQPKSNISFYGKTGSGFLKNKMGHGWFIGWVEKDQNSYIFASQIMDLKTEPGIPGLKAKKAAMSILKDLDLL